MKYIKGALPQSIYKGQDYSKEEVLTVPDQSMSLEEIIQRFTRGEALPVGMDGQYHESEDDLEKLAHLDIVDRTEYIDRMIKLQEQFQLEEGERKQALEEEARKQFLDQVAKKERLKLKKQATERSSGASKV